MMHTVVVASPPPPSSWHRAGFTCCYCHHAAAATATTDTALVHVLLLLLLLLLPLLPLLPRAVRPPPGVPRSHQTRQCHCGGCTHTNSSAYAHSAPAGTLHDAAHVYATSVDQSGACTHLQAGRPRESREGRTRPWPLNTLGLVGPTPGCTHPSTRRVPWPACAPREACMWHTPPPSPIRPPARPPTVGSSSLSAR